MAQHSGTAKLYALTKPYVNSAVEHTLMSVFLSLHELNTRIHINTLRIKETIRNVQWNGQME